MAKLSRPTKLKILEGEVDKSRLNFREPEPRDGRPKCPGWFTKAGATDWEFMLDEIESMGILSPADSMALITMSTIWQRWETAAKDVLANGTTYETPKGEIRLNPNVRICEVAETQLRQYVNCFGLTPSGRASVHVSAEKKKSQSKLAKFIS